MSENLNTFEEKKSSEEKKSQETKTSTDKKMFPPVQTNNKNRSNTKIFKGIQEFMDQLNDVYGKDNIQINKFCRLIMKTSLTNQKVVARHIVIFDTFLQTNRTAILARSPESFLDFKIQATERIYIDMKEIIEKSDENIRKSIWQHLLNIMYLYNPEDPLVKVELKNSMAENDTKENKFLMDTFSKFENIMKTNSDSSSEQKDPMAMMGGLLQSGFLNDMMGNINSGVNNGDLNIKSLIGTVQSLLSNLSETIDKEK